MAEEKQTATPASDPQAQPDSPAIHDKRALPEGVVPKQAQGYVVAGLALLILMAVLFSKNHARTAPKESAPPPATVSNGVNEQRIQELEQNLSAAQRQSQQQQAQAQMAGTTAGPATVATTNPIQTNGAAPVAQSQLPAQPPRDPIADAEKALAFKARFASNLVGPAGAATPAAVSLNSPDDASSGHANSSLVNRPAGLPQ